MGPISAVSSGNPKTPITIPSRGATFAGLFGASFSDVKLRMPPPNGLNEDEVLANTSIIYSRPRDVVFFDYGAFQSRTLTNINTEYYDCAPSISGLGTRIVYQKYEPSKYRLHTANLDGTSAAVLPSANLIHREPAYSPDGRTIIFVAQDPTTLRYRVFKLPAGGGTPVALTPDTDNCRFPSWSPDGTRVALYRQAGGTGDYLPSTMNADGTNLAPFGSFASPGPGTIDWVGSDSFVYSFYSGGTYYIVHQTPFSAGTVVSTTDPISGVTSAPFGKKIVYARGGANSGLYELNLQNQQGRRLTVETDVSSPEWGPYVQLRTLVGPGGATFGKAAGGFLFGLQDSKVRSFLTFDAQTRSTINVVKGESTDTQSDVTCTISADKLTSLKYINDLREGVAVAVQPGSPVAGAVVAFSADTGRVSFILPYKSSTAVRAEGDRKVYKGDFLGIWDVNGRNVAPGGASEAILSKATGALVSHR